MGPLGIQELIFTVVLFLIYAGLLAGIVYVILTVHQIRRETARIRGILLDVKAQMDEQRPR